MPSFMVRFISVIVTWMFYSTQSDAPLKRGMNKCGWRWGESEYQKIQSRTSEKRIPTRRESRHGKASFAMLFSDNGRGKCRFTLRCTTICMDRWRGGISDGLTDNHQIARLQMHQKHCDGTKSHPRNTSTSSEGPYFVARLAIEARVTINDHKRVITCSEKINGNGWFKASL